MSSDCLSNLLWWICRLRNRTLSTLFPYPQVEYFRHRPRPLWLRPTNPQPHSTVLLNLWCPETRNVADGWRLKKVLFKIFFSPPETLQRTAYFALHTGLKIWCGQDRRISRRRNTAGLHILVLVWGTLTFIQGHREDISAATMSQPGMFLVDFDEIWCGVEICWIDERHNDYVMSDQCLKKKIRLRWFWIEQPTN